MNSPSASHAPPSQDTKPTLWTVWSRANLAWVLGLCLPLGVLSVHFKLIRIAQRRLEPGLRELLELLLSDLTTVLAWVAVSLGLVAWAHHRVTRVLVHGALQACAVFYATVLLGAHGYFMSTGSSLDYPMLAFSLANIRETAQVIGSAKSVGRIVAYGGTVVAVLVLPWLLARFAEQRRVARTSDRWLALFHTWSLAGVLLVLAISARSEQGLDLVRDPLLNIALTLGSTAADDEGDRELLLRAQSRPRGAKAIAPTQNTRKKNVVIIMLESTAAWATSLYDGAYDTTPFLASLGEKSVVVERMYAVEPHTTKALVATLCGIEPRPGIGIAESVPGGILGKCLADLLRTQGYRTTMVQAATREFENRAQLVRNMGFEEFVSGDEMPREGLEKANYFGYEDRILLGPLSAWVDRTKKHGQPFFLTVLTNQPHHEYLPVKTYGFEEFTNEQLKNRYLNAVRYDDFVLKELFEKFDAKGLAKDTIFVILGDHGEGFGQHGRYAHDDTIYEEGLRIPMLIYEPEGGRTPTRLSGPFNELDVVPTLLDLLGYRIVEGGYVGRSIFQDGPPRPLYAACYNDNKCIARYEGHLKFIHHFERRGDELFDLEKDPDERRNLAKSRLEDVERMRADAIDWYRQTRAMYREVAGRVSKLYVSTRPPKVDHPRYFKYDDVVEYIGYSVDKRRVRPGDSLLITYHFRVLDRMPTGYRLFTHGYDGARRYTWDHVPVERLYPEDEWRPGQYVSDPHRIVVPKEWRSDKLVIRSGFWSPRGGRLTVDPPHKNNDPVVAEVRVQR